jgi:pilus assembly protein CpaE
MSVTHVTVVEAANGTLGPLLRNTGVATTSIPALDPLVALESTATVPDVVLIDLRGEPVLPPAVSTFKRRFPRVGVVIVADTLDPALMLEGMRAGVSEVVAEPFDEAAITTVIERVLGHHVAPAAAGRVLGFMGAKGGVGTSTIAVNVATSLASTQEGRVLLLDLHVSRYGDAALLLGLETKFSVADALANAHRLDASYVKSLVVRAKAGLEVLGAPARPALTTPDPEHVRQLISRLSEQYAFVVVDLPSEDIALAEAIDPLTSMTLVVNQELATVRRAAQIGAHLWQRFGHERVGAVINRHDAKASIDRDDLCRVAGLSIRGCIPGDYRAALAAAHNGRPLVCEGRTALTQAIAQLASHLGGAPTAAVNGKPVRAGGRLAGLFF